MNTKKLNELVNVQRGYPFRGRIEPKEHGDVNVVQLRNTNPSGYIMLDQMVKTTLTGKKEPDWLKEGDILFAAKGAHFYAVLIEDIPENTVSAPQFYQLRIDNKFKDQAIPEFIAWQLNQIPAQRHYGRTAEGSIHLSIRRSILENTPITLLPFEKQHDIACLYKATLKEQRVLQKLIDKRQEQLKALALNLLDY